MEIMGGLAVVEIAKRLSLKEFYLKWPNDVWVNGHKVAGVLLEDGGLLPGQYMTCTI